MYNNKGIPKELIVEAKNRLGEDAIAIMNLSNYNSRNKKASCPFHIDKDPSFSWYKEGNYFKCFGCGESMDILRYYQEFESMTFIEAVQELFKEVNIKYDFNLTAEEKQLQRLAIQERKKTQETLTNDIKLYAEQLKVNPSIYNHITEDWGLKEDTIDKYKLGYAKSGYFKDRIVIPYLNRQGNAIYATGRDTTGNSSIKYLKLKSHKEIHGEDLKIFESTPLFNECNLNNYKEYVIVVEGEKDCLTLLQEGFQAISFSGSNTNQLKELERFKDIKIIYVIPDIEINMAGDKKSTEISKLLGIKKSVRVVRLPEPDGKDKIDVNDFYNHDREGFKSSLTNILKQASEYKHKGKVFKLTDTGNAERLVYHHGEEIRYIEGNKMWLKWNGKRWERVEELYIERITKDVARNISIERQCQSDDPELQKQYTKFQAKTESKRSRLDMLELAKSEEGVLIQPKDLDKDFTLLNCKNGTINLSTGELVDHNKNDYITKYIDIVYSPESEASKFECFIDEIMGCDEEMVEFMQRAIGYSITGETKEQVLFIPYGTGSNGKSLFLDIIKTVLGKDYSTTIQAESLATSRDGKEASPDIMQLEGKRLVTSSETQKGKGLNEALIKQITGDESIIGRKLYSDIVEFNP